MKAEFIYSPHYDFSMYGIEKLHPFDAKKYSRAWELFTRSASNITTTIVDTPCDDAFLLSGHTASYLEALNDSAMVAKVIEIGLAKFLPNRTLQSKLITPAKYACQGTWLATQKAIQESKIAMNVGGGYHHAFTDHGEGFCFFADAALAIINARKQGLLAADDEVLMIDLDAHRGNGFESFFREDRAVKNFDMYNFQTYPGMHEGDVDDYPFMVPLRAGMQGPEYLKALQEEITPFLKSAQSPKLAFYNAGTDILHGDTLGGLNVSFDEVVERDRYIIQQLSGRGIPTVVMTSGGYAKDSYKLVAKLAQTIAGLCA